MDLATAVYSALLRTRKRRNLIYPQRVTPKKAGITSSFFADIITGFKRGGKRFRQTRN